MQSPSCTTKLLDLIRFYEGKWDYINRIDTINAIRADLRDIEQQIVDNRLERR